MHKHTELSVMPNKTLYPIRCVINNKITGYQLVKCGIVVSVTLSATYDMNEESISN